MVLRSGQRLKQVQIRVYSSSSRKTEWVGATDIDGYFKSKKLVPSSYRIEVSGWGSGTVELNLKPLRTLGHPVYCLVLSMDDGCITWSVSH